MIIMMICTINFILGWFISRWHGGGWFKATKQLKAFAWALPLAICGSLIHPDYFWWVILPLTAALMGGKNTGFNGFFDMGNMDNLERRRPGIERKIYLIEKPIFWLYGKISNFWYDFIGMAIKGLVIVLPVSISFAFVNLNAAFMISMVGLLGFPISYTIGHKLHKHKWFRSLPYDINHHTAFGEGMNGGLIYLVVMYCLITYN